MDQTDPIDDLRQQLSERQEAEAARALARQLRVARFRSAARERAARALEIGKWSRPAFALVLRGAAAAARRSARIARTAVAMGLRFGAWLASTGLGLSLRVARRSIALVRDAARSDRRGRASKATAQSHDPVIALPTTVPVVDPSVAREKQLEALERRELANREARYGPDHVDVASMAWILATRCASRGDDDEARMLFERVLRILEAHRPDDPELAAVLQDLAALHTAAGRTEDAKSCAARAADILARASSSRGAMSTADARDVIAGGADRRAEIEPVTA